MILIISNTKEDASCVSEMMLYMGVLSHPVRASDAFSEISDKYRAVMIISADKIQNLENYLKELSGFLVDIPVFAFGLEDETLSHCFSSVFSEKEYLSDVLAKIIRYANENDLPCPGEYKLAGLDLSYGLKAPMYFDTEFSLTRTQAMILKFLIRSYPTPATPEDILKYAYKESRTPEISNVRTHLSIINKKFREKTGRNLTAPIFSKGYLVMTPEMNLIYN